MDGPAGKVSEGLGPVDAQVAIDRGQHILRRIRPLGGILADLAVARAERERADTELAGVLTKLSLNGK